MVDPDLVPVLFDTPIETERRVKAWAGHMRSGPDPLAVAADGAAGEPSVSPP